MNSSGKGHFEPELDLGSSVVSSHLVEMHVCNTYGVSAPTCTVTRSKISINCNDREDDSSNDSDEENPLWGVSGLTATALEFTVPILNMDGGRAVVIWEELVRTAFNINARNHSLFCVWCGIAWWFHFVLPPLANGEQRSRRIFYCHSVLCLLQLLCVFSRQGWAATVGRGL